ncbi:MAG: SCO family protein [Phyllobacteriaceae bacterium]|nr:SCO family protein [Phyllobacteriaceae bacterium]MBA91720.1 SCO family protein [Phyllobacteriaceae bacterium]
MNRAVVALGFLMLLPVDAGAQDIARPAFDPAIGERLDTSLAFTDVQSREAPLSAFMDGRPAFLIFGYDRCPNLCGVTQRGVAADLKRSGLAPDGYRVLFVSIDPSEGAADAAFARDAMADATDAQGLSAWRFLTGDAGPVLAGEAGMDVMARPRAGQFVHPVAVIALTPDGRIARALPGLTATPRDLRLAMAEASQGQLGTLADRVFLLCAGYDATKGQYTPAIWAGVRAGAVAMLIAMAVAVSLLMRRRRP